MEDEQKEAQHSKHSDVSDLSSNKYVWIIGGIILLIVGWFGIKTIFAPSEFYQVSLVDAPKEVEAGQNVTFTWRVNGSPTTINHTSVHFGTISNAGELGMEVKPADTKYTDFVRDFADGKYDIPLQFVGNSIINTPGKYYFRVHALIKDKNYWSNEYVIDVQPSDYRVSLVNAPAEASVGQTVTFTWKVENGSAVSINHTAVHYGLESNPGELGKEISPTDTTYTDFIKDFANGKYTVPLQFVGNTKFTQAGTHYFRVHALINEQNYWSEEKTLEIKEVQ